jgi:hypothetical protein
MPIPFETFARFWALIHLFGCSFYFFHPTGKTLLWIDVLATLAVFTYPRKRLWQVAVIVMTCMTIYRYPQLSMTDFTILLLNAHWFFNNALHGERTIAAPGAYQTLPVVMFLASACHKLNDDFFNPAHSCLGVLAPYLHKLPLSWSVLAGSVVFAYFFIGAGSLWNRTQKWALIGMCLFQSWMAMQGLWDFATAIWGGMLSASLLSRYDYRSRYFVACLVLHLGVIVLFHGTEYNGYRTLLGGLMVVLIFLPIAYGVIRHAPHPARMQRTEICFALLLFGWMSAPYWGLAQHHVYSMYSNLQLSPFYSNSWWPNRGKDIPRDDWIVITDRPQFSTNQVIPLYMRPDFKNWDGLTPLYVPLGLAKLLLRDGVTFSFRHGGKEWHWPGNALEWKRKTPPTFWGRKVVSNGHCQL